MAGEPEQSVCLCSEVSLTHACDYLCPPLGLPLETTAGLLLCSGRARGLHGSSSLLPGSPSGLKGPDPASGGLGALGGEGASPQGTLPAPTLLVWLHYEAWALQRGCVGCQRIGKAEDVGNILLLAFVATSCSPSILIFVLEGAKSSSFLLPLRPRLIITDLPCVAP